RPYKIRSRTGCTQHLRFTRESDSVAPLLEMAADERDYLGRAQPKWSHGADGFVLDRLGFGTRFNLSDRSLWSLRDEAGLQLFGRQTRRTAAIQNADV